MKVQIIVTLCVLATITNASSINKLFQGMKSKGQAKDFDDLMTSKSKQASLNKYLFKQADLNGDKYISLEEFSIVYDKFIESVGKQSAPRALINSRFEMADHIIKDNRLSFQEFIWLVGSDLSFAYNNDNYGKGSSSVLNNLLKKIDKIYKTIVFQSLYKLFTAGFDRNSVSFEKFKSVINWLPKTCLLKLNWSDCVLRGYYQLADVNGNGVVTLDEMSDLVEHLLDDLTSIMKCYKNK